MLSVVSILFACRKSEGIRDESKPEQRTDSILLWADEGRNDKLSQKSRKLFLDKASRAIKSNTHDTLRIKYYSKLSIAYHELGDTVLFRKFNKKLQQLATSLDNKEELANSHWDLGAYFNLRAIRDSSYYHYSKAQTIFRDLGEIKTAGQLLLYMAIQQSKARAYVESENTTIKAIELLESVEDTLQLFYCYNNLGSVTKELDEFDRSLSFFGKAEELLEKFEDSVKTGYRRTLDNNIGNVYKEQEMWDEAIPYFRAALKYEDLKNERPRAYAQTLNNLAISRFFSGDTTNVLEELNEALQIHTLEDDNLGISSSNYNLATYYANIGDKQKALFHALNAIEKAEQSSNFKRKLESLKLLGWVAPENDLYFDEYARLSERLQIEERRIRDKFARIEQETDQYITQMETAEQEKQIFFGISIGLLLLGIASLIIIYQRIRVQRLRFQQQQQESNQEIFNLMLAQKQKMEEGKQSEQKRISEELHDGVLGAMNGIRMVLLGLNKKSDDSSMAMREEAIEKLKEVQEEIRSISHELNHAAYEKFNNFINSINELIKETTDSTGLEIAFNYDEDVEWDALTGETKINLYRIIQESLQNIVKHAKATHVEVAFQDLDNMLKISVEDNGQGFEVKKAKKGIGQKNIKSRVSKLKGTWNVESSLGKGTRITVILPYSIEQHEPGLLVNEEGELQEIKKD